MAAFIVLNFFKCYKGNHSFVQCFLDNLDNSGEITTKSQVTMIIKVVQKQMILFAKEKEYVKYSLLSIYQTEINPLNIALLTLKTVGHFYL